MTAQLHIPTFLLAAAVFAGPAFGAEATPPAGADKAVTTVRVGGSPADAAFRAAQQRTAADFRAARTACRNGPSADRGACLKTAKDKLNRERREAKAVHDAASR